MKKALVRITLSLVALGLLASCELATAAKDKVKETIKASTAKLMIDLPKSLTTSSSSRMNMHPSRAVEMVPGDTPPPTGDPTTGSNSGSGNSIGFTMVQSAIGMAKSFVPTMAQYNSMVETVIAQNDLTPSADLVTGKTIKITQAMVDEMQASVPEEMLSSAMFPEVGSSLPIPDFTYNNSSNTNFDFIFETKNEQMTMTFYWNTAKTRFGMVMEMSGMKMTLANDSADESMLMKIEASGMVYDMRFKADSSASSLHGVSVSTTVDMGANGTMNIFGYADDNGGGVKFTSSQMEYVEQFGSTGDLTYQGYSDGTTTTNVFGTASTAYDDKLRNDDWGTAPGLFTQA